jgi:hypothetical protein
VLLVDDARNDISAASQHGEIVQLFGRHRRRASLWSVEFREEQVPAALEEFDFDPRTDFLLHAGPSMAIAIVLGLLVAQYGEVRVLMYDSANGTYKPIIIGDANVAARR